MKNTLSILITLILFVFLSKTNAQEIEHLIPLNTDFKFKGYGSVEFKQGKLIEEGSSFLNLKGGAVINNIFAFGLTAGGFLGDATFTGTGTTEGESDLSPAMGYGGVFFEYIGFSSKKVHFSVPVTLGPGVVALFEQTQVTADIVDEDMVEFSPFFVIEPGINLEVNLLKEIKLCIGGSYRVVSTSNLDRVSDSDLSDLMFNIGLKIGGY